MVALAVAALVRAVASSAPGGRFDRRRSGQGSHGGVGGEALGVVAGDEEQDRCDVHADALGRPQAGVDLLVTTSRWPRSSSRSSLSACVLAARAAQRRLGGLGRIAQLGGPQAGAASHSLGGVEPLQLVSELAGYCPSMGRSMGLSSESLVGLRKAKTYPYEIAESSFAFVAGATLPLVEVHLESPLESKVLDEGRVCRLSASARARGLPPEKAEAPPMLLLAYGSNASVEGLSRKFQQHKEVSVLPVARAHLQDFDIVYSSHISPYGAIPAALQFCEGARATVHVLIATQAQRQILRETEPNYILAELAQLDLSLELGPRIDKTAAYLTRHGMLTLDGTELALASVTTDNRTFPAITEPEALEVARDITAPDLDIDDFILENISDEDLSRARTEKLKLTAHQFTYRHWHQVND